MKNKLTKIPIQQLPSGDTFTLLVHKFTGQPGSTVYIQANIHGPEIAGCAVVLELIKVLQSHKTINGSIILVVSANPIGLNTKIGGFPVGSINHNGDSSNNWNRIFLNLSSKDVEIKKLIKNNLQSKELLPLFKKYLKSKLMKIDLKYGLSIEKKLAITLQSLACDADYIIDLHSAGYNQPHIYSFPETIESAKYFCIQHILKLPFEFTGAFDESFYFPWLIFANNYKEITGKDIVLNKEAFTVELENDNEINSSKTEGYVDMLVNYLKAKGVLAGKPIPSKLKFLICETHDYVKYFASKGGLVEPLVITGQKVKKGTPLVKITTMGDSEKVILRAQEDCTINSFPLSRVVSEGEPVIGILKNIKEI